MTFTLYFTQAPPAFPALGRVPRRSCDGVSEPDADGGHVDGAAVAEGTFVVSGGDGAVLAELVYGPFDRVSLLVGFAVERGRAAALQPLRSWAFDLIGGLGDDRLDPAPPGIARLEYALSASTRPGLVRWQPAQHR